MKPPCRRSLVSALLLPALLAAAGCRPPPEPPAALDDALAPYSAGPAAESDAADGLAAPARDVDEAWWKAYNDPQLDGLVETALAANLDLARAALAARRALYQAYSLGADLRPALSGGLSGSARRDLRNGGSTAQSYGAELGLGYEVDLWRRRRDLATAQEWEVHASCEDEAALRLALVNAVVDAYYNLAYLRDSVDALLASLANYEQIEALTRTKYEEGKVGEVEPLQARQSILATRANLLDLQNRQKTVEQTLRNLLNLRPADLLPLTPPSLAEVEPAGFDPDVPLAALSNRPDLRAAEYRLRRAFKSAAAARKSWYPTVSLGSSLSSSGERAGHAFELPMLGASLSVRLPFLDWNHVKWDVRLSENDYERVRLDFETAITEALNEVDACRFAHGKAQETLANSVEKLDSDIQIGDWYRKRYEGEAQELSDWLNALNTITSSRLAVAASRYAVIQSENLVYQAMAGRYLPMSN